MQSNTSIGRRAISTRWLFTILLPLISASAPLWADVINVTGAATSNVSISHYGSGMLIELQLQGNNFALSAHMNSDSVTRFQYDSQSVTFFPTASVNTIAPLVTNPGYNSATLTYNGTNYSYLQISLNFSGSPAITPNSIGIGGSAYNTSGTVSNVPFTMTGTISVYAPWSPGVGPSGPPLFTVQIGGSGNYNATASGTNVSTHDHGGSSTYQLFPTATNYTLDATTQGNWAGVSPTQGYTYGGEGYFIPNGPSYAPSYAAVSITQASAYTWAPMTTDPRVLRNGPNATLGIASAYTGNNFNINVNFTDNSPHRVALYLLDFDNANRAELFTITNANTGAVIETDGASNFTNGIYAVWSLQGNVTINVKRVNGGAAVVSGIFFGGTNVIPVAPPIPAAAIARTFLDFTSQGAGLASHGASGYLIPNGPSVNPSSAIISVSGALTYTWAARTSDPRALQAFSSPPNGIASAYTQYPGGSFQVRVYPVGTVAVSLYLLDWESQGRTETITVSDMATGTVLDSENLSGFYGGIYFTWVISGNVVFTVTGNGNTAPVVSGILIN